MIPYDSICYRKKEYSMKVIIIHHSEITLKKGNRGFFETRLRNNIRHALKDISGTRVKMDYGRFLLYYPEEADEQLVLARLKNVVGTSHLRIAHQGSSDIDKLKEHIYQTIKEKKFDSFRIDTRRADKDFPHNSVEINRMVGAHIQANTGAKVDLSDRADLTVTIEIFNKQVFYSVESVAGLRGLPIGSTGKVVSLLSAGIDSPVSSHIIMTRGCHVVFVHFHSFPFTEKTSVYNAINITELLTRYQYHSTLYIVPLAEIQRHIIAQAPTKLRIILYRRMMFRLAESIAKRERARALVTGESLGQVASQTLENIGAIADAVTLPVLRPLVGMNKDMIVKQARQLGTYEISTEPHDDCCSYLVPKNPETKAKLDEVLAAEQNLMWPELLKESLHETEIRKLRFPESS